MTLTFDVLLVGDAPTSPAVREALPAQLVDATAVETFDDALDRLGADRVNCVVCDYSLPSRDGVELCAAIEARDAELPFVLYTADGDERVAQAAIDAGVDAYFPRDSTSDPAELADRIVELARRNHIAGTLDAPDSTAANLRLAELAMDEAPVGITVADPAERDAPIVYVNEAFERLTGYDRNETLGRNCRFLQGEETDPETVETVRRAIDDERPVSVELLNYRKSGEPFWNQLNIAPVRNDDGDVTHLLGFQSDVTDRKEVELRAKRQAEQLKADRRTRERLLVRLDGLVRRVTAATVDSTSRAELQSRVCEAVVETNDYEAAWIGTEQMTSGLIVADSSVGCGTADAIRLSADDDPAHEAVRTGKVAVADAKSLPSDSPHRRFVAPEGGVAAVPLRYREAEYGVLVVYATSSRTLDEHEIAVFEALGRVVGIGLNALHNQRLLATDETLELVFTGGSPGPVLVELAAEADCEIVYRGAVSRSDGRFALSASVTGADVDTIRRAAAALSEPPELTFLTETDAGCLLEIIPAEPSLIRTVLDHNGSISSLTADADGAELRIELPRTADPSAVVRRLLDRYEGLTLASQRQRERDLDGPPGIARTLREKLTDRQLETIQTAYLNDYFEWSRPVSGDELADSMGITRSTFHQHLRAAQSKIIGEILEELRSTVRADSP